MADPTATYVETGTLTYSGSVLSKAGVGIGVADTNRRVFLVVPYATPRIFVSGTIGGVSVDIHLNYRDSSNASIIIVSALVPTGTTADISLTFNNTLFQDSEYGIYTANNTELGTETSGYNGGSSVTDTLSVNFSQTSGGMCIGATNWTNGAVKTPIDVSGYTVNVSDGGKVLFHLDAIASTGTGVATTTWSGTFNVASGVVAFAPVASTGKPLYAYEQQ